MARKKIKSATDQRKFIMVYDDFFESNLLNHYEKMVFIALKKHADNDTMRAFPSLNRLHKITGISLSQVRRSIEHMEKIGVISVDHRTNEEKGHQSNIYTLHDYVETWSVGSSEDEAEVTDEVSEMKLVAELRSRGYIVTKEKEPTSAPAKVTDVSLKFKQFDIVNATTSHMESQASERYSLEEIRQLFDYDAMVNDSPCRQRDIDSVMNILYSAMNTTKPTIRIAGEDKPSMVVIGKLMKLEQSDLIYAIEKFHEQTGRIKNVKAYLLTILFNAKEQAYLDLMNLGHHNGDF